MDQTTVTHMANNLLSRSRAERAHQQHFSKHIVAINGYQHFQQKNEGDRNPKKVRACKTMTEHEQRECTSKIIQTQVK